MHLGENRARKRDPRVVVHHAVECTHVEGANFDIGNALRGKRTPQLGEQSALQWSAASQENADPLGTQPPRRIAERRGGSGVEPLHVVDGHDKRSVLGKSTQRAENGDSHGALVGSRPLVLLEHERTGQCAALRIGQRSKCLVEHSVEQVAYSRERQRGLALRRTRLENPKSLLLSLRDARTPDRRLADPRLAFQHERHRPVGDAGNEVTDGTRARPLGRRSPHAYPPIVRWFGGAVLRRGRRADFRALEGELVVANVRAHGVTFGKASLEQLERQRVLQHALDRALERAGTVGWVPARLRD